MNFEDVRKCKFYDEEIMDIFREIKDCDPILYCDYYYDKCYNKKHDLIKFKMNCEICKIAFNLKERI